MTYGGDWIPCRRCLFIGGGGVLRAKMTCKLVGSGSQRETSCPQNALEKRTINTLLTRGVLTPQVLASAKTPRVSNVLTVTLDRGSVVVVGVSPLRGSPLHPPQGKACQRLSLSVCPLYHHPPLGPSRRLPPCTFL